MAKGKRVKKKQPFVDIYGVLLLVATLVMSIGYAEIVGTTITVETRAEASSQEGVFITDVVCNESNSVSNNYLATTLDSSITLDSPTDTKSFTVTIYNKTVKPYVFVGVKKLDKWDEFTGVYNNTNISYTFGDDMVPHETIVKPKDWIVFNVDLGFNGQGQMPETLRSLINFSFQEVPTLEVVSEDTIENMYPNCEEKVYEFTVKNQRQDAEHGTITNGVPLTYTIAPEVPAPLTAKIYDEDGTEVATNKAITISSENAEEQIYTMKVKWDNTNPKSGKEYNNAEYAGQTLASSINIIATPDIIDDNDKYIGYTLDKKEPVEIKTAPMYFKVSTDKTTVEMNNTTNAEEIILTIKNNEGSQKVNKFETEYKLSIDNSNFTLLVDGSEIGEEIQTLGNTATISQEHEIQLVSKDGQELEAIENCNLRIEAITPYAKTETIELTIKDTTGPTAPVIQGGSTGEYALSQTISVSEVATDVGTGVNNYQYLLNSTESTETTAIANVTTTATSQTFTEDVPGYYVYFRAVDKAGNVGEWSNAQQIYIDTQKPTVTAKQASVTITEGENYNLIDYFTVVPNGTNPNYTTKCTISGKEYITTENIPSGTHIVTCTATKKGGNSASTTMELVVEAGWKEGIILTAADVANNPNIYSGIEVEGYTCTNSAGVNAWKIFYADSENIYLIADDYIHRDYTPADRQGTKPDGSGYMMYFNSIYKHYEGAINILDTNITDSRISKWINYATLYDTAQNRNIQCVAYMLDCNVWSVYKNQLYAAYAIGSPTIELFAAGYNWAHPGLNIGYNYMYDYGYKVSVNGESDSNSVGWCDKTDSTYIISATPNTGGKAYGYWVSSPAASGVADLMRIYNDGAIQTCNSGYSGILGFRPIVCLKSDITLETLEQGKAKLMPPPPVTATEVAADPDKYYGVSVNYEDPAGDPTVGWQIFHADGENIYLIADDYVHYTYVPEDIINADLYPAGGWKALTDYNIGFAKNENGFDNLRNPNWTNPSALKWLSLMMENGDIHWSEASDTVNLMKTVSWDVMYKNPLYAEYTIGGPTIEMAFDVMKSCMPSEIDFELNYHDSSGYYNINDTEWERYLSIFGGQVTDWLFRDRDISKISVSYDIFNEEILEYIKMAAEPGQDRFWLAGYSWDIEANAVPLR